MMRIEREKEIKNENSKLCYLLLNSKSLSIKFVIGSDQTQTVKQWKRNTNKNGSTIDPIITFEKRENMIASFCKSIVPNPGQTENFNSSIGLGSAAPDVLCTIKNEFTDEKIIIIYPRSPRVRERLIILQAFGYCCMIPAQIEKRTDSKLRQSRLKTSFGFLFKF